MSVEKTPFIRIGDFFFKWRNYVFPLLLLVLFLGFRPAPGLWSDSRALRLLALAGLGLTAAGLTLRFATIGWAYIVRGGRNKQVYADTLVTQGYFATCRNPLYVGNLMLYVGLFLFHGNAVVIALGTALFAFIYSAIVAAEEHFLRAKFGAEFDAYCARVNRWWPNFPALRTSRAGMDFRIWRSIRSDYSTITAAALSVLVILALQITQRGAGLPGWFWALVGLVAVFAAAIRILKAVKPANG